MNRLIISMESLPDIRIIQREKQTKNSYYWDNAVRQPEPGLVVQQTLKGSAFIEDSSGRHLVKPGHAMLFQYGEKSCYGLDRDCERPYELCWTYLVGSAGFMEIAAAIRREFGSVVRMSIDGEASLLLRRLHQDFNSGNLPNRFYSAECAYRLLISMYREQVEETRGNDPISYGRHLLESQFRSPFNLKEWADKIGISREHFTREFHQRYGESPAAYLRRLRLEHAHILLKNRTLNLQDVASASGFASAQTFYRAYKTYYGVSAGRQR
ncbi:MAG: AraC family transcriptional regulator [Kiritimatiellia bacterium]